MLGCLEWTLYVLDHCFVQCIIDKRRENTSELLDEIIRHLPGEILFNILSRLPADFIVSFQDVRRDWKAIISSPYLARLHLERATPTVLVNYLVEKPLRCDVQLIMLGQEVNDKPINLGRQAGNVCLSCDGLLLCVDPHIQHEYLLLNPINKFGRISISKTPGGGCVIGFFFHPIASEYKLIYMKKEGILFRYFIYSVRTKFWKKLVLKSFCMRASRHSPPAILNGALHWIVEHKELVSDVGDIHACETAIMVFQMDSEDFFTMPNPLNQQHWRMWSVPRKMHLLVKEKSLSFSLVDAYNRFINIWILEDYAHRVWVHKYKVDINFSLQKYPFGYLNSPTLISHRLLKLLAIWNDVLIIDWNARGIFQCHLTKNTVIKFNSPDRVSRTVYYQYSGVFTKSLVTLEA